MATEAEQLTKLINDWRQKELTNLEWRDRYYKLRDDADELDRMNKELRLQLSQPASEEIERLKSEVCALRQKCSVLSEALESAKLRRKSSVSIS